MRFSFLSLMLSTGWLAICLSSLQGQDTHINKLNNLYKQLGNIYGITEGKSYSLKQIKAKLKKDTAFLTWIDAVQIHVAILVRPRGEPIFKELPDGNIKLIHQVQEAISNPKKATVEQCQQLLAQLRKQRIEPIEKHLKEIQHVVVLPSSKMCAIPVELLLPEKRVSYAPSATMYAYLTQQPKAKGSKLLALGDPLFSAKQRTTWKPLPGTRTEVKSIAQMFKQDNQLLLLGADATEASLHQLASTDKLKEYRYLHFATHGKLNTELPMEVALILSDNKLKPNVDELKANEPFFDARLTAKEVALHWSLDADLVTLSACSSALGKHARGEGYMGFAQSFLMRGARSVLLSLWDVDDNATALLMDRFYANLLGKRDGLEKPMSKLKALHEAKKWLRTNYPKYAHPAFWGASILNGDPR